MMVETSATPGFVVPFFRHAQVDAIAVVRKPFTETVQESGCCIKEDVAPTLLLISGNGTR